MNLSLGKNDSSVELQNAGHSISKAQWLQKKNRERKSKELKCAAAVIYFNNSDEITRTGGGGWGR